MSENGYTLSDIASIVNNDNFSGGNGLIFFIILLFMMGGWNRQGEFGQYATAASQNEILLGQRFSDLDNKIDRGFTSIGNGLSDLGFSLNNTIKDGNASVINAVVTEGRNAQERMNDIMTAIHKEGEATRAMIQQNKIEALQQQVNKLELNNAMNGVVRYPNGWTYNAGTSPFCGCNECCN